MSKKRLFPKLEGSKLENFEPLNSVSELVVIDLKEGEGQECPSDATIKAHYTGALCADGTIFQSSLDSNKALTFGLHQVIQGWGEGVPGMREGGVRRLIIPAEKAYGSQSPASNIPKNSDLVFDIELIEIK